MHKTNQSAPKIDNFQDRRSCHQGLVGELSLCKLNKGDEEVGAAWCAL